MDLHQESTGLDGNPRIAIRECLSNPSSTMTLENRRQEKNMS
jgi:hypothetical protein